MKSKGRLLPLLCMLVTALLLPAGATAKPGHSGPSFERSAEAHLAGTHGYRITISASNEDLLVAARKGTAGVNYVSLAGKLKGDRIDARLPGVGRISLAFREHDRSYSRAVNGCRTLTRKGVFVGYMKIKGERDYTSAESRHVRGEIVREPLGKCRQRAAAQASSIGRESIMAISNQGRRNLFFMAWSYPSMRLTTDLTFVALSMRVRGQMVISNAQIAFSKDAGALEIATPPRSATVHPPTPFTGSATFQQEPMGQFSWTGELAVELPGIGEVHLAGPKFEAELCRGRRCKGNEEDAEASAILASSTAAFLRR